MKNYEISIWEDVTNTIDTFQEKKIAVIGSDSMTSEARAFDPVLVRNINGTHTLTFKMYYVCNDFSLDGMEKGFEKYSNPFIPLMVNERRVKLHWKDKWYDFVIKNCQEDSNDKTITYTCKDLFLNELGKTGFNLEFDNELLNNSGTIQELAERVLEGTDWKVDHTQATILQEKDEPVYESVHIKSAFTGAKDGTAVTKNFSTTDRILLFHSCVPTLNDDNSLEGGAEQCQFLFTEDSNWVTEVNQMLVINADCYSTEAGVWDTSIDETHPENSVFQFKVNNTVILELPLAALVSNRYRGTRLVKSQKQVIDKKLNRSVYVYTDKDDPDVEYWGYPAIEFNKPTLVNNLFVNYENFKELDGWLGAEYIRLYPLFSEWNESGQTADNYEASSYMRINGGQIALNKGLDDTYMSFPNGFVQGEKYIFRYKVKNNTTQSGTSSYYINIPGSYVTTPVFLPRVASYYTTAESPTPIDDYFSFGSFTRNGDWIEFEATCTTSISKHDIITGISGINEKLGLFLVNNTSNPYWVEKVEFFKKVMGLNADNEEVRIDPGNISTRSISQIYYNYYLPNQDVDDPSEIVYAYHNTEEWNQVVPAYRENPFEEVRSITGKNSNRFNFLQSIAEAFDCWCEFIVEHNDDGTIQYTTTEPIEAKKYVRFVREIGKNNGLCFTYGLDLNSISRTVVSDQIVTKTIVPKNSNSFGLNGFCTISRCEENYPKVNYILNFDYYISHGMIDSSELNNDLYSSVDFISMGYYYNLHKYNKEYDELTEKLINRNSELTEQLAYQTTYSEALESTQAELERCKNYLISFCGVENMEGVKDFISRYPDEAELNAQNMNYARLEKALANYTNLVNSVNTSVELLQNDVDEYTARQEELKELITELDKRFYTKYSRFIQEGSWTSEDYYDDLSYYLDAVNVSYTSSRPQISYNINVKRLSEIEEFKNRKFELGDICFVEDTEFFGYVENVTLITPYREKVLISEVTESLDDPTRSTFKVQNYKTQFEDLFQRITATTQSLQYSQGNYERAASVVTTNRTIEADVIQNSILANENLVIEAQNESIYQDNTGITLIDSTNPDHRLKITSYGIFVTDDGVWRNALRGDGIVTEMLSAGNINTNKIVLSDGIYPSFRWDKTGINAYQQLYNTQDPPQKIGVDLGTSVRFDHFGLYGIQNISGSFNPITEEQIWEEPKAKFGLTWKGFFLRTNNENGRIEISSDKDFTISQKNNNTWTERVKIGRLSVDNNGNPTDSLYGIRISDSSGSPVMETGSDGNLWLRKSLNISKTQGTSNHIQIGYLDGTKPNSSVHEVFNATDKFIVYEDGSVTGTNVNFTGGTIGNMSIDDITHQGIVAKIDASANTFYDTSPANILLTASLSDSSATITHFQWKKNNTNISGATSNTYTVLNNDVVANTSTLYSVDIIYTLNGSSKTASASFLINKIPDFEVPDVDQYLLKTSQPEFLKFNGSEENVTHTSFSPESMYFWAEKDGTALALSEYSITMNIFTTENSIGTINDILNNSTYALFAQKVVQRSVQNKYEILLAGTNGFVELSEEVLAEAPQEISTLIHQFKEGTVHIQIILNRNNKVNDIINIPVRFGITNDMATFSIYSNGIVAAIQNTGLTFNAEGLTITDGGFQIVKMVPDPDPQSEELIPESQFYVDSDTGTLVMRGVIYASGGEFTGTIHATDGEFNGTIHASDGDFRGVIHATSGEFNGEINAISGRIGGFIISDGLLYSSDENRSVVLDGAQGNIIANSIELGTNAVISDYLQVGTHSYIRNPQKNNGVFIESAGITITENGTNSLLNLGSIIADGENSTISGNNWTINPDKAVFNNIDVMGTIHTSVFETGSVQAVGGNFIFRESGKIITDGTTTIVFENKGIINQFIPETGKKIKVYLIGEGKAPLIRTINSGSSSNGTLTADQTISSGYDVIIKIGVLDNTTSTLSDNLVIGVNSTSTKAPFLYPKGFTFSAPDVLNSGEAMTITQAPNLFLGDLSSLVGIEGVDINFQSNDNKYGLYGDNVFLKGTLTTKIGNNSYAGINTINGVTSTFIDHTSERIVFWAGAANNSTIGIQEAPFQVTERGFVYGSNARFTGTIIADSYIDAAELYTPKIYGGRQGENNAAELSIYDAVNGIVFYDTRESNPNRVLSISPTGLSNKNNTFIDFANNEISFQGNNGFFNKIAIRNATNEIRINDNQIGYYTINSTTALTTIKFNESADLYINLAERLLISSQNVDIETDNVTLRKDLIVGNIDTKGKLRYTQVDDGYELYVEE